MIEFILVAAGLLLVAESGAVTTEPGKQLPQVVILKTGENDTTQSVTIHYLLFVPQGYRAEGEPLPLLLFLHGLGESGDGEPDRVKSHGPANLVEHRPDFPFIVVSPQSRRPTARQEIPTAWKPNQLIPLVDHVASELNVDQQRIYVTGLSMGGYGTWRLAAAHPERIAAAVPICGGGDPQQMAAALAEVPIWAFHGARDQVVPVERSREMVDAVRAAGGDVRLTVYPDAGHDSWTETYNNDTLYEWLLSHRRE